MVTYKNPCNRNWTKDISSTSQGGRAWIEATDLSRNEYKLDLSSSNLLAEGLDRVKFVLPIKATLFPRFRTTAIGRSRSSR